jgi:hypothetical protein
VSTELLFVQIGRILFRPFVNGLPIDIEEGHTLRRLGKCHSTFGASTFGASTMTKTAQTAETKANSLEPGGGEALHDI